MTEPLAAVDPAREVRRILVIALLAVLVAAPVAFVLLLRGDENGGTVDRRPQLFPATYAETGFVARGLELVDDVSAPAGTTHLRREFSGAATAWVIARCDAGSITVQVGSLSSSRQCTGEPVGVAALDASSGTDGRLDVVATVSRPQRSAWGVAVYR